MLSDSGYDVSCASSRAEALKLLAKERFHVAVVDVRLEEPDEDNQDGLLLMRDMRAHDPSMAVLILTGHGEVSMVQQALRPDEYGIPAAFDFLEKREILELPKSVARALKIHVHHNDSLTIVDQENYLPDAARKISFLARNKEPSGWLDEEIDELLGKLFVGCERIDVSPLNRENQWAVLVKVVPWLADGRQGDTVIAKLGEHKTILTEIEKYTNLLSGIAGGHRLPISIGYERTRSLSGIAYTFARLGETRDFGDFYASASPELMAACLENLFIKTCFHKATSANLQIRPMDLTDFYLNHLQVTARSVQNNRKSLTQGHRPFHFSGESTLEVDGIPGLRLPDPMLAFSRPPLQDTCPAAVIHGELYGYNVLVDNHQETWLINFDGMAYGPVMQDYATFELYTRIFLTRLTEFQEILHWEQQLHQENTFLPGVKASLEDKALHTVRKIRGIACDQFGFGIEKSYQAGLLYNALKLTTVPDLPAARRDHALLCAAFAMRRLLDLP